MKLLKQLGFESLDPFTKTVKELFRIALKRYIILILLGVFFIFALAFSWFALSLN